MLEDTFMKIVIQIQPYFVLNVMTRGFYKIISMILHEKKDLNTFDKFSIIFFKYSFIISSITLIIKLIIILNDL